MTSPLYSVGQSVAVSAYSGYFNQWHVFPATKVVEHRARGCPICKARHQYKVDASPLYYCESDLRPIKGESEYLTDSAPQKLEQPA